MLERFLRFFGFSSPVSTRIRSEPDRRGLLGSDRLSRYVLDPDHFRPNRALPDQLHFRAFLPARKRPDELSIFETDGLAELDVWERGDRHVGQPSGRQVLARGDFVTASLRGIRDDRWGALDVVLDDHPPGHGNVVGWPPVSETEARNNLAKRLRAIATPVPR